MRLAACALLLLAACAKPLPPGVESLTPDSSNLQSFFWSPLSRRLAYVEGRFPNRTYLVVSDRAANQRMRTRFKGFALGPSAALSRDGRRALLDAGKIGPYASRQPPVVRVVLYVDTDSGQVLSEESVGPGGTMVLGHPAWSLGPVAAWNAKEGIAWKSFGQGATGGILHGPPAWSGPLLDEPYIIVADKSTESPRLTAYDLRDGRAVRDWRAALSILPLGLRRDGTALAARWTPESARFLLEAYDPNTDRREVLLESDGEIETAIETDRGLYVIAKDTKHRNDTGKDFLAPRVLLALEASGRRWSVPWTSHRGLLLGSDPHDGRLIFAVTDQDRPGAWALEPSPAVLASAARFIDGK